MAHFKSVRRGLMCTALLAVPISFVRLLIEVHNELRLVSTPVVVKQKNSAKTSFGARSHVFPRWGEEGIAISSLTQYIDQVIVTCTDGKCVEREFAFTLYIVDADAVWTSRVIRGRNPGNFLRTRITATERIFQRARSELVSMIASRPMDMNISNSTEHQQEGRWPLLVQRIASSISSATTTSSISSRFTLTNSSNMSIGFPFIAWYGDFTGCNHHNWKGNHSIPIFSVCARVTCPYGFPTPTYATYQVSREHSSEWDTIFAEHEEQYPWESKIPQVVWRGSLSGQLKNYTSFRWRIATYEQSRHHLLNIGIHRIPARHKNANINVSALNGGRGLVPSIYPMSAFQKYKGILDIDGNSWSSRFGALLCYNSVVLKVEPDYIDYFYRYLQPWYHYIPVRADLSDLTEKAAYVMNPVNEDMVLEIIGNANAWCRQHMVRTAIAHDVLDIWEAYLKYLQSNTLDWMQVWKKQKDALFDKGTELGIAPLGAL